MSDTPTPPRDLTVNKVVAGAAAAATAAVLGSFFGAVGTVAGAAIGSVASTVATALYQRSLDRTQERLRARFRRNGAVVDDDRPPAPARRRRRWPWAVVTLLVFAVGLLAVTGLELVKGSSLTTGEPGTSVGRVLSPSSGGGSSDRPEGSGQDRHRDRTGDSSPTAQETPSASPVPTASPPDLGGVLPSAVPG